MATLLRELPWPTNEETRAHWELVPLSFRHKLPFLFQKFLVSPVHFGRPPLVLVIRRCVALGLLLLLLLLLGLARRIQRLERAIASLLWVKRSLVLRMMGSDIIFGVIIGVRSGLFLGGWPRRQIGSRWQRRDIVLCLRRLGGHVRSSILAWIGTGRSGREGIQQGLNVNIGPSARFSLVVSALG